MNPVKHVTTSMYYVYVLKIEHSHNALCEYGFSRLAMRGRAAPLNKRNVIQVKIIIIIIIIIIIEY